MLVNKLGQLEIPFEGYSAQHHGGQEPWDEANCNKIEGNLAYEFRIFKAKNFKDWVLNCASHQLHASLCVAICAYPQHLLRVIDRRIRSDEGLLLGIEPIFKMKNERKNCNNRKMA